MKQQQKKIAVENFEFDGRDVRIRQDPDGAVWFVGKDVCECLGIGSHRDALARLDEDERGSVVVDTPGGPQEMSSVNEPGLYNLIFTSRKPEATTFKKWVTHEVLPEIRATGSYQVAHNDDAEVAEPEDLILQQAHALKAHRDKMRQIEDRQNEIVSKVDRLEADLEDVGAVPPKTLRAKINDVVRGSIEHGSESPSYARAWGTLYREYRSRYRIDLRRRASNDDMKPLDWAERYGHLHNLWQLAHEYFV